MCIVGEREQDSQTVSVRHRTAGDAGSVSIDDLVARLVAERDSRGGDIAFAAEPNNA